MLALARSGPGHRGAIAVVAADGDGLIVARWAVGHEHPDLER